MSSVWWETKKIFKKKKIFFLLFFITIKKIKNFLIIYNVSNPLMVVMLDVILVFKGDVSNLLHSMSIYRKFSDNSKLVKANSDHYQFSIKWNISDSNRVICNFKFILLE